MLRVEGMLAMGDFGVQAMGVEVCHNAPQAEVCRQRWSAMSSVGLPSLTFGAEAASK